MSALILMAGAGLWFYIGYVLWRTTSRLYKRKRYLGSVSLVIFFIFWLVGPWFDEWLGSQSFRRQCDTLPAREFYGPVSVGQGKFFDEAGRRLLWTQREIESGNTPIADRDIKTAYAEGQKFMQAWKSEFTSTKLSRRVQEWPVPIYQETITYVHSNTGKPILVSHWIGSPGGWIKRVTGWGNHSPYQCAARGQWPLEAAWIKF